MFAQVSQYVSIDLDQKRLLLAVVNPLVHELAPNYLPPLLEKPSNLVHTSLHRLLYLLTLGTSLLLNLLFPTLELHLAKLINLLVHCLNPLQNIKHLYSHRKHQLDPHKQSFDNALVNDFTVQFVRYFLIKLIVKTKLVINVLTRGYYEIEHFLERLIVV
jgi:hypothetical protein